MKKRKFLSQVEIEQLIAAVHEGKNSVGIVVYY